MRARRLRAIMDYCDVTEYACHAGHATPLRYTLNIVHSVNAHTVQLVSFQLVIYVHVKVQLASD